MAEYKTKQKQMLSEFLQRNCEKVFTIEEICEKMASELENAPSKSTVYRLIPHLVNEGTVRRIPAADGSNAFLYQMIADNHCKGHLHLKCSKCGKIIHLKDRLSNELLGYIRAENGFAVSQKETIIFGQCADCN